MKKIKTNKTLVNLGEKNLHMYYRSQKNIFMFFLFVT